MCAWLRLNLLLAINAERVVPDDPVAQGQTQRVETNFQLGDIFIADGDVEGTIGLQDAAHGGQPALGPGEIIGAALAIVVNVVFVADVEGGIGEGEIHARPRQFSQMTQTIANQNLIHRASLPFPPSRATQRFPSEPRTQRSGVSGSTNRSLRCAVAAHSNPSRCVAARIFLPSVAAAASAVKTS